MDEIDNISNAQEYLDLFKKISRKYKIPLRDIKVNAGGGEKIIIRVALDLSGMVEKKKNPPSKLFNVKNPLRDSMLTEAERVC